VAENVNVAIVGPDLKALVVHPEPLVQDLRDFVLGRACALQRREAERALIRPIAGIAFHVEFHDLRRTWNLEVRSHKMVIAQI
jgi:hypothetical protein